MINIICLGKIKEKYLNDLIEDYKSRIEKYTKLKITQLKDTNILQEEGENILKNINPKDYVIVCTPEGKSLNSIDFAKKLDEIFNFTSNIVFVIGSSNGLDNKVKSRANLLLSFSEFTIPHGLFRGLLLEQIYRAYKINNNESYHK